CICRGSNRLSWRAVRASTLKTVCALACWSRELWRYCANPAGARGWIARGCSTTGLSCVLAARLGYGAPICVVAEAMRVVDVHAQPRILYRQDGVEYVVACDFIAGCDGFHGICRPAIPADRLQIQERQY